MSVCPLCSGQRPEWVRVGQEPPSSIQIQPPDSPLGSKDAEPFLPTRHTMDQDDPRGHRQSYNRYRAGAGIPFLKRAFAQNQELLAASAGNLEWLHHSLKHRKGIRSDCRGFTALHLAAERGHLDCVIALVDRYKFPLSMTTTKGWTPLHLAINKEKPAVSLKCIQFLLEKGAPVNVQNQNGVTPLHLAAWEGMLDCIKVLVKAGADVHALDRQNRKSIDLCRAWNHRECARFLKDAMWKQDKKDLAEEMGQLSQLKKRLLVMQNKYLLEKKVARGRKMAGKDRQILSWRASLGRGPVEGLEEGGLRGPSSLNSFAFRPGALSFYPSLVMQTQLQPLTFWKEKEAQNQVAFTQWLQTKPLPRLAKIKILEPAGVTKESAPVTKKSAQVTEQSASVTKKSVPVSKEPPRVTKEAAHMKKYPQVTKPQPPRRPHPPCKRPPVLILPARQRLRPLKRTQPSNTGGPLTVLPSLSPRIPNHQSRPSSGPASSPRSPRSSSHSSHGPSPPLTARSRGSTLLKWADGVSSATIFRRSPSLPLSLQYSPRSHHRHSYTLLHTPTPQRTLSESQLRNGQKRRASTSPAPSPPMRPLALLHVHSADTPLTPPPARPSSSFRWTATWNSSTKAEARPVTQIAFPQVVRLGVHPDTTPEPDLCNFLKFYPNGEGGAHIQTADGQWIFPVPRLPFKVLLRELCPSRRAQRLRVPEGLRRITVQDLPRRRYPGDQRFWTDSMAMSLRDTFDPAFISLVRKHQGLPPLSPTSSPSSSLTSSVALRQCWAFLFYSFNNPPL
ncbi:ankyrin repeat domain-containing protein 53 [Vombatus ursinus]|uniref:ankyrin repeat domain-containing protein 53 n=1 Tax=Vombatus ursinus TaxID=29139 RepID=UPI000FFD778E|nr:ankyrin repeat domain-containing protein 53 [Vombatus ursinus]